MEPQKKEVAGYYKVSTSRDGDGSTRPEMLYWNGRYWQDITGSAFGEHRVKGFLDGPFIRPWTPMPEEVKEDPLEKEREELRATFTRAMGDLSVLHETVNEIGKTLLYHGEVLSNLESGDVELTRRVITVLQSLGFVHKVGGWVAGIDAGPQRHYEGLGSDDGGGVPHTNARGYDTR
jgi:hypothetical protein